MRTRSLAGALAAVALAATTVVATTASAAPLDDRTNVSFQAAGLSSEYHVYASGIDTSEPVGLLLQFHGDGGFEFRNPSSSYSIGGSEGIAAQAAEHNIVTVVVRTPDWSTRTWWRNGSANADYVKALVGHLRDEYPVADDRTWLVGYSGGAQFVTQFYLPKHSSTIAGGGAVIFGGGGVPRVSPAPFADELKNQFPMHWYTGLNDDGSGGSYNALRDARNGSAWYAGRGFDTDLETPAGVGHGLSGRFGPVVGKHLDDHADDATSAPDDGDEPADEPDEDEEPAEEPAVSDHEAARTGRGMTFTGTVAGTDRVVLRASKNPLDGQVGWWLPGTPDADGTVTIELTKFEPELPYWWQLEDRDGNVLADGELEAAVTEPDPPEADPDVDAARAAVAEAQAAVDAATDALEEAGEALDDALAALDQ